MKCIFELSLDVRWREMDAFEHVNNAQYFSYVEETRVQWFNDLFKRWQTQDTVPNVASIHMDYRRPLLWPERICVQLFATKKGTKSITIGHRIISAHDSSILYAEGYSVLVWVNASGQSVAFPEIIKPLFYD